eukprot:2173147-Lingulodinium_polyedra.AAC.1
MQHAGPKGPQPPGRRARHPPPLHRARRCSPRRSDPSARFLAPAPVAWLDWALHRSEPVVATR